MACLFVYRRREKKRQQQRLAAETQQHRAHPFRQQQQPAHRPSGHDSPDWFGDADQNQGHGYGHGHVQANHGWGVGFDAAATTAQTNFGETPQTYRPFADATTVGPSRQLPNFLDPFATMDNRY